jgi:hypothetical protein
VRVQLLVLVHVQLLVHERVPVHGFGANAFAAKTIAPMRALAHGLAHVRLLVRVPEQRHAYEQRQFAHATFAVGPTVSCQPTNATSTEAVQHARFDSSPFHTGTRLQARRPLAKEVSVAMKWLSEHRYECSMADVELANQVPHDYSRCLLWTTCWTCKTLMSSALLSWCWRVDAAHAVDDAAAVVGVVDQIGWIVAVVVQAVQAVQAVDFFDNLEAGTIRTMDPKPSAGRC